jgi:hypothetical protein
MKRRASLALLFLAGTLQGFGSSNPHSVRSENQFNFQPAGRRAQTARKANTAKHPEVNLQTGRQMGAFSEANRKQAKSQTRPRKHTLNPPTGKVGFVSATEVAAGGGLFRQALSGDFNGDSKADVVTLVGNYVANAWVYSISVVLSNGDGTFQPAVLTAIPNNDWNAQIVVGDVNGDKKDDIIVAHQNGYGGYTTSSFDVLLSNGDGTFTVANNYSITTNYLSGGTLADVNGDGKLDAVVVDQNSPANVWTLLGNGDGTFQAPTSVALNGNAGYNTVFADINGDGLLDLADDDYNSGQMTIYLATSATTYANGVAYTTSDGAYDACSIASGDMTGDGKPEIVSTNCSDNTVTVYLNNGDGTFQTGVYYAAALEASSGVNADVYPEAVTIADVNGDGKGDVIVSNVDSSDVTVLLSNGDGTVQVPTTGFATGGFPRTPAVVADFNGDGLPDIMVTDDEYSFVYLKGYGDGTFRASLNYYSPITDNNYAYGIGIASGDFNGDGIPDFVIGNYDGASSSTTGITVFLSRPDGSMRPAVNYGSGGRLYFVAVADFNQDGKLDIAATNESTGIVQIFTGAGDGTFTAGSTFATDTSSTEPEGLVAGDFNHDGYPDLAVQNGSGQNVGILINDGTGNFMPPVTYPLSMNYSYQGIATADLNGDSKLDLVVPLNDGSAIAILLGNGDGTFQTESDVTTQYYPLAVAIADFNGDGKLDLAATVDYYGNMGVEVALGNGDGTFQTPIEYLSSLQDTNWDYPYPTFIQAADIDSDGKLDLVYVNSEYSTVGVLFGLGDGTFYDPVEFPAGGYTWGLVVADVNGDGATDVVTAGDDFSGVNVLLNANGSATKANYTVSATPTTQTVTAGSSATFVFTVTPSNHYNGTVTFSCGSLPTLASCSFNPPSVTLDGDTPVTVQLTITTTAVTAMLHEPSRKHTSMVLASLSTLGLFGLLFAGGWKKRSSMAVLFGMLTLALTFALVGCGSSGSGSSSTKAATSTSVSSSQSTVTVGQTVTFTGQVTASSGSPTGSVTFMDGSTSLGSGTLSGGSATFQTQSLAAGVHNITATYSGDSSFNSSTSSALTQTVDNPGTPTGSYSITVTATGTAGTNGGNTSGHPVTVNLTVQ